MQAPDYDQGKAPGATVSLAWLVRIEATVPIQSGSPSQTGELYKQIQEIACLLANLLAELALIVDVVGAEESLGDGTRRFADLQPVLNKVAATIKKVTMRMLESGWSLQHTRLISLPFADRTSMKLGPEVVIRPPGGRAVN